MRDRMTGNGCATAADWRSAMRADREARAERLRLPSGAVVRVARPDPLDWIMSGRIPQMLLRVVLADQELDGADRELSRDEVVDLARFAAHLVEASVIDPPIGDGPGEIALDEIPIADRAFIFEWACRALGESGNAQNTKDAGEEVISSRRLERFRQE